MPTMFDLFTAALTGQHARLITLHTTAADDDLPAGLVVERFEGREGVNELSVLILTCSAPHPKSN